MTADADTRYCRKCGAAFKRSPQDTTVHCPDHRGRPTTSTTAKQAQDRADAAYIRCGEARARGKAAQAAGDTAAYEAACKDFRYWADVRAAAISASA